MIASQRKREEDTEIDNLGLGIDVMKKKENWGDFINGFHILEKLPIGDFDMRNAPSYAKFLQNCNLPSR